MEATMEPKFNLWIENNGEVVLSIWRVNFLHAIASSGSLQEAAQEMKIPFNEAQEKLLEMERGLGFKLMTSTKGELEKTETHLTAEAEEILKKFGEFSAGFEAEVIERFNKSFRA